MHLFDNLQYPCVCIELLLNFIKKTNLDLLNFLPLQIQNKIHKEAFMKDLYFPAFLAGNRMDIIESGRKDNHGKEILQLYTPSLHQITNSSNKSSCSQPGNTKKKFKQDHVSTQTENLLVVKPPPLIVAGRLLE